MENEELTYKNCIGKKINQLTILKKGIRNNSGIQLYICQCDCKKYIQTTLGNIKNNNTTSCGCYNNKLLEEKRKMVTKHGLRNHPLYGIWSGMKTRCYNKNREHYKYYGGKGVRVCEPWLKDFTLFYHWALNNGWQPGLTIDRIDVNGNYEPNNCRWVDFIIQNNNRDCCKDKKKCEINDLIGLSHIDKKELFKYELSKRLKKLNQF